MENAFDVIVVGAGPGGSSAATFLSRHGISTLVLDKANFPRDKVCGDGLAPQATYWLDILGCVDKVLEQTNSCITSGDLFINGEYVLTGKFPQNSYYPGFCVLLERKKLDYILLQNAISNGAQFRPNCTVKKLHWTNDGVVVEATMSQKTVRFHGKIVIGADGANSIVSRLIGNTLRDGTTAVSVRGYYEGVAMDKSHIQLYFDERFFPGYGWVFVDDDGKANIGVGYAFDKNFKLVKNLKKVFNDFVTNDLKKLLKNAKAAGNPDGGWACFYKPKTMIAPGIMLIGDAANMADPLNGGGIHMAMESAYLASSVAIQAIQTGDCSMELLRRYEDMWKERTEIDRRTGELLLSIAKNPNLREIYLLLIKSIARLAKKNPHFEEFCGGVFCGTTPASSCISPLVLMNIIPFNLQSWITLLSYSNDSDIQAILKQVFSVIRSILKTTRRAIKSPLENLYWGTDIMSQALGLMGCLTNNVLESNSKLLMMKGKNTSRYWSY